MRNALCLAGYFAIAVGIIIAIYIVSSLKVIDISAIDFVADEAPHPYRWLYAGFVLAVTLPLGMLAVTVSHYLESKEGEYTYNAKKRREEISRDI
ncbi:hypothetical protein [Neobacillus bataviensis]|uniref:hypothetical protein n=1 Tax=Neobacillus bataviensis TaxID=220685 RepID=UPI001CC09BD4|nr:hypothetical protein [Neobacillus bataviensis]